MKKNYIITIVILLTLFLAGSFSNVFAQIGSQYCQVPISVKTASIVEPNLLFVIDSSGSMSWMAYDYPSGAVYDATKSYEGYFDPNKFYTEVSADNYKEHTPTGLPCTCTCNSWRCRNSNWGGCTWKGGGCSRWGCCLAQTCTGDCNIESGNYLNFLHMARIDLLRWAVTGGTPSSCSGSHTFDTGYCDPELWDQVSGSGKVNTVCNNSIAINDTGSVLGGCILVADDGTQVAVPWSRVNASIMSTLKTLSVKPRIGAMSYRISGVMTNKVYIGDFLSSNNKSQVYPYMNLITHINSIVPSGATPSGPAMWDALNYYEQKDPEYGGFSVDKGGDHWKNPMYVCDGGGGTNCTSIPCASNFVLLMSDGQWNTPYCTIGAETSCNPTALSDHSSDPVVPAYCMHKGFTNSNTNKSSSITAVYTVGLFLGGSGEQALKNISMYGAFEQGGGQTWPGGTSGYPNDACTMDDCFGTQNGSACEPLPASTPTNPHNDWDKDADGVPDTFYKATNAYEIRDKIVGAIEDILRRSFSGTAASILASNEGSGANLIQAVFYPRKMFTSEEISWTGILKNFWYYLDSHVNDSYIREDTHEDQLLKLNEDNVALMFFDTSELRAKANLFNDTDGNGSPDAYANTVYIEDMKHIWEAGNKLWSMPPGDRKIKTNCSIKPSSCSGLTGLMNFTYTGIFDDSALWSYIQASNAAESEAIVRYIRGEDTPFSPAISGFSSTYRDRTVSIGATSNVWKLADIANSTPKVISWVPMNKFYSLYGDQTYHDFVKNNPLYTKRGIVFAGANDGMLHAFNLGLFEQVENNTSLRAKLCNDANDNGKCDSSDFATNAQLGKEMWAFIPKNALPYLKYLTDPNYCHLYYVDLPSNIVDASIDCSQSNYWECDKTANSWRTILIGGMRLGGACKDTTYTGSYGVNIPVSNVGYSSYFALDITDTADPKLLWEFSNPDLGFSTSGPAIVKINTRSTGNLTDIDKNGKWFVVFASGPTGPIDMSTKEFKGFSDQELRLFVLDLKTGSLLRTINTGIQNAFGGSMKNASMDYDLDYQDDVLYFGYTQADTSPIDANTTWTKGGVIRLVTKENFSTALNPTNWDWSYVAKDIGPVTTGIAHIAGYSSTFEVGETQNAKTGFLYFGTGRDYYEGDDNLTQRHIFGIIEPCLSKLQNNSISPVCNDNALICNDSTGALVTSGSLQCIGNASSSAAGVDNPYGWYIELNPASSSTYAERNISTPVVTSLGSVYFVTFAPRTDICSFGGNTYLWQVDYSSGGALLMEGKAVMQVSTGVVEDIGFQASFNPTGARLGRQSIPIIGRGNDSDFIVQHRPEPTRKVLHIGK